MKKEVRPIHDDVACDICGRTILKGERFAAYLAPGGNRHMVCELCNDRALHEGWIRESAHADLPAAMRRQEPRRSLFGRLRRRRDEEPVMVEADTGEFEEEPPEPIEAPEADYDYHAEYAPEPPLPPRARTVERPAARRKDFRHVRAVPTNAQAKVERAFELFNQSQHVRTVAGIGRTLGEPWVCAQAAIESPSEVSLVIAWELSWYRYRVDLASAGEAVTLAGKGQELDELDDSMRDWNASALPDGRLAISVPS